MTTSKRGRSPRGSGSMFQRADGRWQGQIHYLDVYDRPRRKYVYGKTLKVMQGKFRVAEKAARNGLSMQDARLTVGAWLEEWLEQSKASLRPSTWRSYESYVRVHLAPAFSTISVRKLSARDIENLQQEKLKVGLSPRTVELMRAVLRRALTVAVRQDLVGRNVATLVSAKSGPRFRPTILSAEEALHLINGLWNDRLGALFVVAVTAGLRSSELRGLQYQDIDWENGVLHVSRSLQKDLSGKLTLGDTKTGRSQRSLPLTAVALEALRVHRERQAFERAFAGDAWVVSDFVFTTTIGTPLDGSNLLHRFHRLLLQLGLPQLRLHDLRHSCATLLLSEGVELRSIMEILGHSSIVLTANTYGHVTGGLKREAAGRMDGLFRKQDGATLPPSPRRQPHTFSFRPATDSG